MVDTSSPRPMSRSILVHMFWPPLLLDLLLLLCRRRRRRRRYYCYCCCCCAVTCSCVRSKKHKTIHSLLRRVVLRDASRVVKQQQHNSSTAAAQQQQQQRRWRRRGSRSGQFPYGVSGWLLCYVSVAERVCALSLCVYIWLSLVALESYTTTSKPSTNTSTTCDTSIKVTIGEAVIWSSFLFLLIKS